MEKSNSLLKNEYLLESPQKSLEERLEKIVLSESKIKEIKKNKTVETITDSILGSFKVGEIVQTIINWNKDVDEELKSEKEKILISNLLNKVEKNELQLHLLVDFFQNPYGWILTNKIFEIAYQSPLEKELLEQLSNLLKNITKTDFVSLFSKHKFFINLIAQLSSQSLAILIDYKNWPTFNSKRSGYHIQGRKIVTPWTGDFARSYIKKNNYNLKNISLLNIIEYSAINLLSNNLVKSKPNHNKNHEMVLTELGVELLEYLE